MTTELELLNSLCIRYINLSYRARPIYTSLAFVSKTFPLIFFQIYIYTYTRFWAFSISNREFNVAQYLAPALLLLGRRYEIT